MRRIVITFLVLDFLALSGATARILSGNGAEREQVVAALRTEAEGARIDILRFDLSARFPVVSTDGFARVVWRRSGARLPTVECFPVRRAGLFEGSGVTVRPGRTLDDLEGGCAE